MLCVGRSTIYDLFRAGQLRSVKIGRRRLIQREALEELLSSLETAL
jgi:excisionase family DNA binding protein